MIILNKPLLEKLSNAFGPPGYETEPRNILIEELQDYADEVKTDKLGNVFFTHKGDEKAPVIMLAAHTDEVAVLITDIDDDGFLRFHPWGIVANVLPGQRMMLKGKKRQPLRHPRHQTTSRTQRRGTKSSHTRRRTIHRHRSH